jgi:hypothetical protein
MLAEADKCTVDYFSIATISRAKPPEIDQTINGRRRQHEPLDHHRSACTTLLT